MADIVVEDCGVRVFVVRAAHEDCCGGGGDIIIVGIIHAEIRKIVYPSRRKAIVTFYMTMVFRMALHPSRVDSCYNHLSERTGEDEKFFVL